MYAIDLYEVKYQLLINKIENTGLRYFSDPKAFTEYSNDMDDIFQNIEEYKPNKKRKILVVFDDMVADMVSNKKLNPIVTKLLIRGRKLNISLAFMTQSCFAVPKNVRLNSTYDFAMKITNKRELHKLRLMIL